MEVILGFEIKSGGDVAKLGSDKDMFYTTMQRIQIENIPVTGIRGYWINGTNSTNYNLYRSGIDSGLTAEQSAMKTRTGQRAGESGFTQIQRIEDTGRTVNVWFGR